MSNKQESHDWEEIETVSLQNENSVDDTGDRIDETSFIFTDRQLEGDKIGRYDDDEFDIVRRKSTSQKSIPGSQNEVTVVEIAPDRGSIKTTDNRRSSTDTSLDGRSITPKSDTRSYREKLKDRINTVKEKAGISAVTSQKTSKNYKNSKVLALSRMTDIMLKEEADVREALERHEKQKELKKHDNTSADSNGVLSENLTDDETISYHASVDFFTKHWEQPEDTIGSTNSLPHSPQKGSDTPHTNEAEDSAKLLTADYLGLKETLLEPSEFRSATVLNKTIFQKNELIHCPSIKPIPLESIVSSNGSIRNPKEEGIFVPQYPPVSDKIIRKIQRRLLIEGQTKWFGDDGELIREPLPLEMVSYHPFRDEDYLDRSEFQRFESALIFGSEEENSFNSCISSNECYVLELKIISITFTHHPLFSREHVLANMLSQLYEKYKHRLNVNITKRLICKLRALRSAHDNLRQINEAFGDETTIVHREKLRRYKMEIRETRKQRMLEGKNDNELLMKLLSTWKDLKRIRAIQGYTSTDVKLQIIKSAEIVSSEDWQNEITRQVTELTEEARESVERRDDDNKSENYQLLDSTNIPSEEKIRERVVQEVTESLPAPGEPSFVVTLIEQESTPDAELTNQMEIQRRALMKRTRIWFRIFYNGHEVCKSTAQSLERRFNCVFNQKFSIRLQEWPESLSVQIYCDGVPSKGLFSENPLAEVFIPLPASGATLDNVISERYEFSNSEEVGNGVRHTGVGSGIPFKLFPENQTSLCLYTSASIACQTGWGMSNNRVLSPPEYFFNKINVSRRQALDTDLKLQPDVNKLKEWFKTAQLDPNDPNNVTLFALLKRADLSVIQPKNYLDIGSALRTFEFCSEEDLVTNSRLKLLVLRDRGEIEFKNAKTVPLKEWEIPKDIFKSYDKRVSNPELPFDTIGLGQMEIHRAWGHHSLNMLYDRILKQCKLSQQHRNIQDVVHEEKVPDIGTLGLTFMKLFQPKRPLRPKRKGRKRIPVKGLTGQEVKVIVNVVRAFEVPVRKDVDTLTENNISYVPVRPFVEVSFKGQSKRTVTADGPNPTWNQDLYFSVIGPNESSFHISKMHSFEDSLHIHLFDEIIVDILEDERIRDTTIHQRMERNWLGSLRIPFSTLYFNHQVEGTFQLYSPPFLLGYDRQVLSASSDHSYLRNSTFLTLFIIVQPPLSPPDPIMEHLECSEPVYLEQHLEAWKKEITRDVPHRAVKTLVTDVSGKSVCVTRFFRPIEPPVIYEGETTPEMIARYVSLIPVSTSGALLFGYFNVWLTCDQTIRLLLGEREDHAILLCCFLMKLGLKAWLLFGNGIPHGQSAYVLTKHDDSLTTPTYNIWDPATGLKYSSMDSFSPLQKVYCLISDENIWVNIQAEELIRRTNFDISQRSDWWPAFGRNVPAPATSIQPDKIEYTVTSKMDGHLLQDKIEKYLRDSIMKWRPTSRTTWNRYCIATLRKLLPIMERETCGIKQQSSSDHLNELQHILGSYKVCGFPISQPFTNIKAIIEAVKSTGVHINENPDVEFALAVYVHLYPNDVLSIWVYAVSLIPRR